jgi:hypothetical protein
MCTEMKSEHKEVNPYHLWAFQIKIKIKRNARSTFAVQNNSFNKEYT